MVDSPTTRHLLQALLLATSIGFLFGDASKDAAATETDAKWVAQLKQYGYTAKHLRNKVEHGEFTTFELGSPNYKILNPEDEPEYITADQPHYQEMLRRLTSSQSGSDTIDVDMAVRDQSQQVTPEQETTQIPHRVKEAAVKQLHIRVKEAVKQIPMRIKVEMHHPRPYLAPSRWEKLNRKRSSLEGRQKRKEIMVPEAKDEFSVFPEFEVYQGARPFQRRVANLN